MILKPSLTLVETSAWIETLRPKGDAAIREKVTALCRSGLAAWCPMVKLELWNGALAKEMPELEVLDRLVVALDITFHVWHSTYELARKARLRGKTFPAADLLIAACAKTHGAEVLHKDRHFDQILAL